MQRLFQAVAVQKESLFALLSTTAQEADGTLFQGHLFEASQQLSGNPFAPVGMRPVAHAPPPLVGEALPLLQLSATEVAVVQRPVSGLVFAPPSAEQLVEPAPKAS